MPLVVIGILADQISGDSRHVLLRLTDRDAWLEPPDSHEPLLSTSLEALEIVTVRRGGERQPQSDAADTMTVEVRAGHANHGEGAAVESDRLADDLSIPAKLRSPEPIADDGNRRWTRWRFLRGEESATKRHAHTQDREEVGGHV